MWNEDWLPSTIRLWNYKKVSLIIIKVTCPEVSEKCIKIYKLSVLSSITRYLKKIYIYILWIDVKYIVIVK